MSESHRPPLSREQSSIAFMQQEHATILKALHDEIAALQKRCTDLTFQLTMSGLSIDEPGSIDMQMQEVQQELESSRTKIHALEKTLTERDKKIERLEAEARTQRKRWLDESRAQGQTTNSLRAELEAKANNIAYLTSEMHKLKQRLKSEQQSGDQGDTKVKMGGSNQPGPSMNQGPPSQPGYLHPEAAGQPSKSSFGLVPTPPAREKTLGGSSASRIRRSGHSRSVVGGVSGKAIVGAPHPPHPASADGLMGRTTHPNQSAHPHPLRLSSARSSGSESPDITPFLPHANDDIVQVVGGKQAPILPPIASSGAVGSGAHPVLVHQVVSSTSQHRQKSKPNASSEAAIVSLAVENAADNAWNNMAHESQSTEFN